MTQETGESCWMGKESPAALMATKSRMFCHESMSR